MIKLNKLHKGDKIAVLSPSFAAPGQWPHVYELGLKRLKDVFGLEPVEFPATKKLGASKEERSNDLISAFENKEIKGVIASLGGNDQITYIKNLPKKPFIENPKPFFGYSDNTHFENFLWLNGIPSFYGGSLFVEFAEQGKINDYTLKYLKIALFDEGEIEILPSEQESDIGLTWDDPQNLTKYRIYDYNSGWIWNGNEDASGIIWGGCLESIDEILRHNVAIPSIEDFKKVVLITETSEETPSADCVFRVYRALGERGILDKIQAILVGRAKSWENYEVTNTFEQKSQYRKLQQETILKVVRQYNQKISIIQNMDFGHTAPQIPMPYH